MSKQAKVFSIVVLLLLMLSSVPSAALARSITPPSPPHQPARFAENDSTNFVLLSTYYVPQKGPVFNFQVNGHVNKEDLHAAVFVTSSKTYKINCVQNSETAVVCSGPKSIAGLNGAIYLAGFGTWLQVPDAREAIVPAV